MHLKLAALALTALLAFSPAQAQEQVWRHAGAFNGEPKYPEGFAKFDYADPNAPVGGVVRLSDTGGFDTFNPILPQGETASGIGLIFETLTEQSFDEISTQYGHLAEAFSYPADYSSVTFRMNPRAKWADGEPVTAEDVVWSFNKTIELNPSQANYFANVTKAEVSAPGQVTFTFDVSMDLLMRMQNSYDIAQARSREGEIKVAPFKGKPLDPQPAMI